MVTEREHTTVDDLADSRRWSAAAAVLLWLVLHTIAWTLLARWLEGALSRPPAILAYWSGICLALLAGVSAELLWHLGTTPDAVAEVVGLPTNAAPVCTSTPFEPRPKSHDFGYLELVGLLRRCCRSLLPGMMLILALFPSRTPSAILPALAMLLAAGAAVVYRDLVTSALLDLYYTALMPRVLAMSAAAPGQTAAGVEAVGDEGLAQRFDRSRGSAGEDLLTGFTLVEFAAGQRQANVHLAFSPGFAGIPVVTCVPADESPVRIKITVTYPYGVRLECKRNGDAGESLQARLLVTAQSAAAGPASQCA